MDITAALAELAALRKVCTELDKLDPAAQQRALRWLYDRYALNGADGSTAGED